MFDLLPFKGLIDGIISIGKEFVVDKDKQIEFAFKTQELAIKVFEALLNTHTTPKVDAAVKLLIAFNSLWRPLGGLLMTCFGLYAHYKQIPMDTTTHAMIDGALPAWGVSRHIEKNNKIKAGVHDNQNQDPRGWD